MINIPGLSKFDVIKQIDLADISRSPTQIYKLFNDVRQNKFESDQRIVFYTSSNPPDELLRHIESAAEIIDISEFFILICCPYKINTSVQSLIVPVENSDDIENNYKISSTICPLLWSHMEVEINGDYKPCCVSSVTTGKSVRDSSINEAFNSDHMNTLRAEFLNGQRPKGCNHCWEVEDQNLTSIRMRHLKSMQKDLYVEYLDNLKLRSIDIKSGNTCNFKCRICGPSRSSLIADEVMRSDKTKTVEIKSMLVTNSWAEKNYKFFAELEDALPNLVNIDMAGGESFLVKQFDRVVQLAVSTGYSKQMRLHYNTNGSIFPEKQILQWGNFKKIDLALSIDNIGQRFELERGGSWSTVENNIKKFLSLNLDNLIIYIMPTVNIQNVYYIPELVEWARSMGLSVVFNYLSQPIAFNIDYATTNFKQLLIEKYKNYTHPELVSISNRIQSCRGSNGSEFIKETKRLDLLRGGQSFQETHPEVAKAMGYSV
jgi:MoaA/NifB/PqqE/SkfB family radical SAM enzyme